jgi:hypothetical protein
MLDPERTSVSRVISDEDWDCAVNGPPFQMLLRLGRRATLSNAGLSVSGPKPALVGGFRSWPGFDDAGVRSAWYMPLPDVAELVVRTPQTLALMSAPTGGGVTAAASASSRVRLRTRAPNLADTELARSAERHHRRAVVGANLRESPERSVAQRWGPGASDEPST